MTDHLRQPEEPEIPGALVADLRRLEAADRGSHAALTKFDAARVAATYFDRHEARHRRRRMLLRGASLAAAAGLALAVVIVPLRRTGPANHAAPPAPLAIGRGIPGDLDGDGTVDMIDALRLARLVHAGTPKGGADFTGDGAIDQADIDRLAFAAVRLSGGGL